MKKSRLILFLIFLLAACSQPVVQNPTITVTANTTTAIQPSETNVPVMTPTVKASDTPTLISTETPSPAPTSDPCSQAHCSPDGMYIAKFMRAQGITTVDRIEISQRNGSVIWTIPTEYEPSDLGSSPGLTIERWSKDSSLLYFYYHSLPDGGDYDFWWTGSDLQSINVVTGEIQNVLSGSISISFAFSPQETSIAYAREGDDPYVIYVRDLSTGVETRTTVEPGATKSIRIGNIYWLPSGKGLAFQIEKADQRLQTYYLNIESMQLKMVNEYKLFDLQFLGWAVEREGEAELWFFEAPKAIIINTQTGEIIAPAS